MWQKIKVNKGGPRAPLCSVQCSSQWQSAAGAGSSQVHQSSLARAAAALWPALVVLLSPPSRVRPNSDSPPGARPACLLPHPHSPHRFCCRRPGAFLSWHRHSSTSKLGSPLAENWLIPRESPMSGCFLQRKFAIKSQ